jgi:beta-lactamase superfamily II metal-dependent hydrolase
MPAGPVPESVAVRMYQVGFGDCFLVSFTYAQPLGDGRDVRHMLVDFGSTHGPKGSRKDGQPVIEKAAALLEQHTAGTLDVVVLTHRHRDHLSGFGDAEAAAVITRLGPKLVVRPWTENPELPHDATEPAAEDDGDRGARFARHLAAGQQLAARVEALTRAASSNSDAGRLAHLALDQVPNPKAIAFLDALADGPGKGEYLSAGQPTQITKHIPGIAVRVLGPPTIAQHAAITKARSNDPDEFWLGQLGAIDGLSPDALDRSRIAAGTVPPGPVAWIVEKLARQQVRSLQRIVRTVDDALNNTSLILLVDAGDRRLLLPGDAQIENWSWSLMHAPDKEENLELLAGVDLYKVGHHGSRNATPKSLFHLWEEGAGAEHPMTALLSTMPDVHGRSEATKVPRGALVEALDLRMNLVRTDKLDKAGFVTVSAPCSGDHPYAVRPGA